MILIKKVLIQLIKPYIIFDYKESDDNANLLHTNIISNSELAFGEEYIKNNLLIVSSFINELILENNINKVKIKDQNLGLIILDIFKNNKQVTSLYIEDESPISFDLYVKIIKCKSIKTINCYTAPKFIIEQFDKRKITIEARDEIFFTSYFMEKNNLINYSKMYYKNSIIIDKKLDNTNLIDLDTFLKINKHLKTIHLNFFDKTTINQLVALVYKHNHKSVVICIHENINDIKIVDYLKKINKNYKRKYHVEIKIVYSNEYINNNIFSQLVVNNIKMCCLIIIGIFLVFFIISGYNSMKDRNNVAKITNNLNKIVKKNKDNTSNVNKVDENGGKKVNELFLALLQENSDTKGWLKINNTNIDYPVVQSQDNDHYLYYDFNNQKNYNGWIFADYRNNFEELDQNTIIYGHNKYLNQTMFGTLDKVLDDEWLSWEENKTISFNTLYEEHNFKIFSVYKITKTNDYLVTSFNSKAAFKKYLNVVKKRSIKKFDVNVTEDDKILTLSTCIDKNKRLVVHAVLMNSEKK